jgi:hypothetical protein
MSEHQHPDHEVHGGEQQLRAQARVAEDAAKPPTREQKVDKCASLEGASRAMRAHLAVYRAALEHPSAALQDSRTADLSYDQIRERAEQAHRAVWGVEREKLVLEQETMLRS